MANTPARKRVLDFSNVKERGQYNPKHVEDGIYKAKITAVEEGLSKSDNEQWIFTVILTDYPSSAYPYYCALNADALWKVRNLFVACGVEVPKKRMNVDPAKLVGKFFYAEMVEDEYEGRMKSVVQNVMSASDYKKFIDENSEEPEEPKRSKKARPADDEDEEDFEDEEEETPPPAKKKRRPAPEPEEDDEDEEEEEEEPAPRKKAPAKKATKKRRPVEDDEDDEEFDLDEV